MAQTTAKRTRLHPDLRRERLLVAARKLFETHPYDQLTTKALADGCGVSEGLLFHYFGSKRALYVACLELSIAEFVGSIEDPGPDLPLDERLRHALDSYLDFVERYPRSYAALLRGGIGADGEVHDRIEEARQRFSGMIMKGLGIQPEPSFSLAVWAWMGFVEAACTRWLAVHEVERDELRDLLAETALVTFSRALEAA